MRGQILLLTLQSLWIVSVFSVRTADDADIQVTWGGWGKKADSLCGKTQSVCFVTANKAAETDPGFKKLFHKCVSESYNKVDVVVFALQDHAGVEFDRYVNEVDGLEHGERFKLRHRFFLTNQTGEGHFCYSAYHGGAVAGAAAGALIGFKVGTAGHLASPFVGALTNAAGVLVGAVSGGLAGKFASQAMGVGCGGVALVVYSKKKVEVEFDQDDSTAVATISSAMTATTAKGSVAARFEINKRQIVFASTHGTEGIRAKDKSPCSAEVTEEMKKQIKKEHMRVEDFRQGFRMIKNVSKEDVAVLWGGDFNPRSADPKTGCPIFPEDLEPNNPVAAMAALAKLQDGRDILGEDEDGKLTTFSKEQGDLVEASSSLKCPTYKKKDPVKEGSRAFYCRDSEEGPWMHYKTSHPPSWTDRIFRSTNSWMSCGTAMRAAKAEDHDGVFVICDVAAPEC